MSKYMLISTDDVTREIATEIFDTLPSARKQLLEGLKEAIGEEAWNELIEDIGGEAAIFTSEISCGSDFGVTPMSAWANRSRYANHPDVDWKIVEIPDVERITSISVVIEVSGGMVQNVYANGPASVEVYDFDTDDLAEGERLAAAEKELREIEARPEWHRAY